jgi:ABC-type dipeptide/oligopeptide/nickel transport system permease subunit
VRRLLSTIPVQRVSDQPVPRLGRVAGGDREVLAPYELIEQDYLALTDPPAAAHPLGTDDIGGDVLSRTRH